MQQKQLIWLAGSLLILLTLAFISGTFDNEISTVDVPALSISSEQIENFEIVTSDSSIYMLSKIQGKWKITAPVESAADSLTVARFTENLDDLRLESVVSTNPQKYETYGVGPAGKHVNITWGRNKKTFYIGENGPDFQSFYVRLGNDPRVFLSNGRLNLPENLDTWRDKTVINLPEAQIDRIAVSLPGDNYEVVRSGTSWLLNEDDETTAADSTKVTTWLRRFTPLKANAFLDDLTAADVKAEATHQIHFSVPGGSTQTLWALDEEAQLAGVVSGKNATFRLTSTLLSSYFPAPEDLAEDD